MTENCTVPVMSLSLLDVAAVGESIEIFLGKCFKRGFGVAIAVLELTEKTVVNLLWLSIWL